MKPGFFNNRFMWAQVIPLLAGMILVIPISRIRSKCVLDNLVGLTLFMIPSLLSHIALMKLRLSTMPLYLMSALSVFFVLPSLWLVAMSFGWSDKTQINGEVFFLAPLWFAPGATSELICAWRAERHSND